MILSGFYFNGLLPRKTTMFSFYPGHISTKIGGITGLAVEKSRDMFELATEDRYLNPGRWPKYYK